MEMEWFESMPKVELHAHLNGSIRDATLLEIAKGLGEKAVIVFSDVEHVILKSDRSLKEVFKLFDLIHIITTDHDTVTRITKEVVEDFASENVIYLELRTTPKRNDSKGMSKRSYMNAVIEGLRSITSVDVDFAPVSYAERRTLDSDYVNGPNVSCIKRKKLYVRLLLSIDRRETTASAMETVKLALEMKDVGVVGIDLSGNPVVGEWNTFLPALKFAREQGLPITLHCGEVYNQHEIHAMLEFLPERIGHACCLEEEAWRKLKSSKIPVRLLLWDSDREATVNGHKHQVEICLTSNIRTNTIPDIDGHHFADLYKEKHPLIICTDDSGVFSTSLSKEYTIAAAAFGLSRDDMFKLSRNAVEYVFADDYVIEKLQETFDTAAKELNL
ncbi:N6-mAMP deaminase-like protein [Drosera capensis]